MFAKVKRQGIFSKVLFLALIIFTISILINIPGACAEEDEVTQKKRALCKEGNQTACFKMGERYRLIEKDNETALSFYIKACHGGYMTGCTNGGILMTMKGTPYSEHFKQARKMFTKSCDAGEDPSCFNLGTLDYKEGRKKRALKYYLKACDMGNKAGCDKYKRLSPVNSGSFSANSSANYNDRELFIPEAEERKNEADTTDKIEKEEFLKKAREELKEIKKSRKELKALSESIGKFNSNRRNKCIQAFGHEQFCRCLSNDLHMDLGMVDYVAIITMDKNKLDYSELTKFEKGVVDSAIRIREKCVRETINISNHEKLDTPKIKRDYWDNGKLKEESHFKNGKREGLTTLWHMFGGKASESYYKNGIIDGVSTWWHENGVKEAEALVKNGKQEGLATYWHDSGKKKEESHFKNGKREGLYTHWYKSGGKNEAHYKNGKLEGLKTYWYESGDKKGETNYKNGKKDGAETGWHENRQKQIEKHYNNGKEDGLWTEWSEGGRITLQRNFVDGYEQ